MYGARWQPVGQDAGSSRRNGLAVMISPEYASAVREYVTEHFDSLLYGETGLEGCA